MYHTLLHQVPLLLLVASGIVPAPFAGRTLICHVKMFAHSTNDKVAAGEYRIIIKTSVPTILSQTIIYEAEEAGINMNNSGSFSVGVVGGLSISCTNTHTLVGFNVLFSMTVETYQFSA